MRVASYCRVSTDHEDQANSFAAQKSFFQSYIAQQPDWELHAVYADEGISGTSTRRRTQFLQMIEDALNGAFRLILTKEISRFSRNILDTIAYTRMLKSAGVGVLFMTENLNTLDAASEMLLTFMGTLAQEESRRTSVRVKWGQMRRMEQGVVFGPSLLGYKVNSGRLEVDPEGAELVRLIFHKYGNEHKGTSIICRELREEGYRTANGNRNWNAGQIVKILKNEKYIGDLVQKKSITPDFLTHVRQRNRGEEELVILRDHHESIIDRSLWDAVQQELAGRNRRERGTGGSTQYALSGKIKCGECGANFISRIKKNSDGSVLRRWGCRKAATEGCCCKTTDYGSMERGCDVGWLLREEELIAMINRVLLSLEFDREKMIERIIRAVARTSNSKRTEVKQVARELERLEEKKLRAIDACFAGEIGREDLNKLRMEYDETIKRLHERQESLKMLGEENGEFERNLKKTVAAILSGELKSDVFYKTLIKDVKVFRRRSVEVRLNCLHQVFVFRETD